MIIPDKLKPGDEIRVIAPARSMGILSDKLKNIATKQLTDMGFKVTFGKYVNEINDFNSSSIESRILDLHDAFADENVKGILTVIGGFNSNQLLRYIDWDLIKNNPKVFCGYSDITALCNSIYAKTGLVTYYGPHYSTFGQKLHLDYTLDYFKKCCMSDELFNIKPSEYWTNDPWYKNQDDRNPIKNDGIWIINEGKAEGTAIGGNLCTLNLLQGTEYIPSLDDSILFIEDDNESDTDIVNFDRDLQSLIHLPDFSSVKGIAIGRHEKRTKMTNELLTQIIKSKKELNNLPVIANVDFGHTDPKITIPIGGKVSIDTSTASITIKEH